MPSDITSYSAAPIHLSEWNANAARIASKPPGATLPVRVPAPGSRRAEEPVFANKTEFVPSPEHMAAWDAYAAQRATTPPDKVAPERIPAPGNRNITIKAGVDDGTFSPSPHQIAAWLLAATIRAITPVPEGKEPPERVPFPGRAPAAQQAAKAAL